MLCKSGIVFGCWLLLVGPWICLETLPLGQTIFMSGIVKKTQIWCHILSICLFGILFRTWSWNCLNDCSSNLCPLSQKALPFLERPVSDILSTIRWRSGFQVNNHSPFNSSRTRFGTVLLRDDRDLCWMIPMTEMGIQWWAWLGSSDSVAG